MVEELKSLYAALYDPQNHEINEVSEHIAQLYEQPETISAAFQILNEPDPNMRKRVAVGFKMIISSNKDFLIQNGFDPIKTSLLEILTKETDNYMFENLVQAVGTILKNDGNPWPELFEFGFSLLQSTNVTLIINGLHLFNVVLEYVDDETNGGLCEQILPALNAFFSIDNEEVVKCSAKLLDACFLTPDLGEALVEPATTLVQVFIAMVQAGAASLSNISSIADSLESIFNSDFVFEDLEPFFAQFIETINNEAVQPSYKQYVLQLAADLISKDMTLQGLETDFITSCIQFFTSSYEEGSYYDQQEFLLPFEEAIDLICKGCSKSTFITHVLSILQEAESPTAPLLVALASCFKSITSTGWEVASKYASQILEFAMQLLQFENEDETQTVCVIEAGYELLMALFLYDDPIYKNVQNDVLTSCVAAFETEGLTALHYRSINTISSLLLSTEINPDLIQQIAELLEQLAQTDDHIMLKYVIGVFGDLADSAKEQIQPYIEGIMGLLISACQMDEPENIPVKSEAITAISTFVPYISENSEYFALFCEAIGSDDVEIITAGFEALLHTLKFIPSGFEEHFAGVIQQCNNILGRQIEYKDSPDEEAENDKMEHILFAVLNFLRKAVPTYPSLFGEALTEISAKIDSQIESETNVPKIIAAAIEAGVPVRQTMDPNITEFSKILLEKVNDEDKLITISILKSLSKALEKDAVIEPDVLALFFELLLPGFQGGFDFLADSETNNYDGEFYPYLTDFFCSVSIKVPSIFPLDPFISCVKATLEGDNSYLKADVIRVLSSYFEAAHNELQLLHKKEILRIMVSSLEICETFEVPPDPIVAVRTAVELEPEMMVPYLEGILQEASTIMETEDDAESIIYKTTLTCLTSLLFTIFKVIMKGEFNCEVFMPFMLNQFPCLDDEAANCYESLAFVCSEFPEIMGQYGVQVIVALAKTLGLREHYFKRTGITPETFVSICILFNNLAGTNPQAVPAIDQALADQPGAQDRINARLEQAAQMVSPAADEQ